MPPRGLVAADGARMAGVGRGVVAMSRAGTGVSSSRDTESDDGKVRAANKPEAGRDSTYPSMISVS